MTFPSYRYISLEDLQNRQEAAEDPRGFLRRIEGQGTILDEVQRAPELFSYLQGFLDERRGGPLVLTGSQQVLLHDRVSQSLAGRVALLELLPLSVAELSRRAALAPDGLDDLSKAPSQPPAFSLEEALWKGGYPALHDRGLDPAAWLDGYLRTYVERDVRVLGGVGHFEGFSRFVMLCAGRAGQLLNASSLASDAGVSHVTARNWLSILQAGYLVTLVRPHHQNFSRRMVKAPKLCWLDSGLLCHLLGLRSPEDLKSHPHRGAIFENFILSEGLKAFMHHGESPRLYFWRDSNGREVDGLLDFGTRLVPLEVKYAETVPADAFRGLDAYGRLSGAKGGLLFWAGAESYSRGPHQVRAWWTCS